MGMQEFEPVPNTLQVIRRYYSSLSLKRGSYDDLLSAAGEVLNDGWIDTKLLTEKALFNDFVPTAVDFDLLPDQSFEQFTLLPMKTIALQIDARQKVDLMRAWYRETVQDIMILNKGRHSIDVCIYGDHFETKHECSNSFECPLLFTADYLQKSILLPDFTGMEYLIEPEKSRQVDLEKINIAVKFDFQQPQFADLWIYRYDKLFYDTFGEENNNNLIQ